MMIVFNNWYNVFGDLGGFWCFMGMNVLVYGSLFLFYMFVYVAGQLVMGLFVNWYFKGIVDILQVVLGVFFIGFVIFFLGVVYQLSIFVIGILVIVVLVWCYCIVMDFW